MIASERAGIALNAPVPPKSLPHLLRGGGQIAIQRTDCAAVDPSHDQKCEARQQQVVPTAHVRWIQVYLSFFPSRGLCRDDHLSDTFSKMQ